MRFEHIGEVVTVAQVQRSPNVILGHHGSLSAKSKKIAMSHKLLHFVQKLKHVTLAVLFKISGFHDYAFLA